MRHRAVALLLVSVPALAALGARRLLPGQAPPSPPSALISPEPASAGALRASASASPPEPPAAEETEERCGCSAARRVSVREGDVFLCEPLSAGDSPERLTSRGGYLSASLSPLGNSVVALRHEGRTRVPLDPKKPEASVEIDDNRIELIDLATRSVREVGRNGACLSLAEPRFLDERLILVKAYGFEAPTIHNRAACVINLPKADMHVITRRGTCAMLVSAGRFRGMIYTSGYNFRVGQGLSDYWRVVDRTGRTLRDFDENPLAEDWNGDGFIMNEETSIECSEQEELLPRIEARMRRW